MSRSKKDLFCLACTSQDLVAVFRTFLPAVGSPQEQGLAACATVRRGVTAIHRRWHGVLLLACQRVKGSSERDSLSVRHRQGFWRRAGECGASDSEVWRQLCDSEAASTQGLLPYFRLHCVQSGIGSLA